MSWVRNLLMVTLAIGCGEVTPRGLSASQLAEPPRDDWMLAIQLPIAAAACRDAGYPAAQVRVLLDMAQERHLPPSVVAEALQYTAVHARQYGPVGDMGRWLGDKLIRQGLRGSVLDRTIQAHHATWGANRVRVPAQGGTSALPSRRPGGA